MKVMIDIDEAVEIIGKELSSVYCDNCRYRNGTSEDEFDRCEDCHRKYMQWAIDKDFLRKILIKKASGETE